MVSNPRVLTAINNAVAASATVGLLGREGAILLMTVIPTIYYLVMAGVLTMIAIHGLGIADPMMLTATVSR